jgi:ribosomal protein S5
MNCNKLLYLADVGCNGTTLAVVARVVAIGLVANTDVVLMVVGIDNGSVHIGRLERAQVVSHIARSREDARGSAVSVRRIGLCASTALEARGLALSRSEGLTNTWSAR